MERYIPDSLPFTRKKLPIRAVLSYIFDYAIIVLLAAIYSVIDIVVTPFQQPFSLRNFTIQYPFAVKERIPIPVALAISVFAPMTIIAIYTLALDGIFSHRRKQAGAGWSNVYPLKDRLWELNCGILGLLLAEGAAFVITGSLKNLCGKPRPDLIARCQPFQGAADPPVFGLSNITICTQTDRAIMADGFRSFPSGHSSGAFAGLFYLSLYLAAKLHVLDNRGEVWRTFIVLIPTLAASCIAMSRIMDARHHPFDVLFGSAVGILLAWAAYRQYFPPVSDTWKKGRAYPIRTWGTAMKGSPMGGNEIVHKDSDMEPYRTSGPTESSANMARVGSHRQQQPRQTGNVFRDQISRSQRQRGGEAAQDPYVTAADGARYVSPRHRDEDDVWSATTSSSEDEINTSRGASSVGGEGFEMQKPSYMSSFTTSDPEGAGASVLAAGQIRHVPPNPRTAEEDEDTEYRSQTVDANLTHPGHRVLM